MVFWRDLEPRVVNWVKVDLLLLGEEWRGGEEEVEEEKAGTVRDKSDVFTPVYGDVEMFAYALETHLRFLHRSVSAKAVLLLVAERGAGFHKVDLLNTRC